MKYLVKIDKYYAEWLSYKDVYLNSLPEVAGFFNAFLHGEPCSIPKPTVSSSFNLENGQISYRTKGRKDNTVRFSFRVYKLEDFMNGSTCHNFFEYPFEGIFEPIERYRELSEVFPKLDDSYSESYMEPYQLNKTLINVAKEFNKGITE